MAQSIVSLMKSLVDDLLIKSYRIHIINCSNIFAEKLKGTFALQKFLKFFRQKMTYITFEILMSCSLTNSLVLNT